MPDKSRDGHAAAQRPATTSHIVRSGILVLTTIAVIWVCQWASAFIIPLAVGIFLAFWLTPLVNRLERLHVPRARSAACVVSALVSAAVEAPAEIQAIAQR